MIRQNRKALHSEWPTLTFVDTFNTDKGQSTVNNGRSYEREGGTVTVPTYAEGTATAAEPIHAATWWSKT